MGACQICSQGALLEMNGKVGYTKTIGVGKIIRYPHIKHIGVIVKYSIFIISFLFLFSCNRKESLPEKANKKTIETTLLKSASDNHNYNIMKPIGEYASVQDSIYNVYTSANESDIKKRNAYVLSELWKHKHLNSDIKSAIAETEYELSLFQIFGNHKSPNFTVINSFQFPFPSVWITFTPTLFVNGDTLWAADGPVRSHSMSLVHSTITSRIGGKIFNDDTLQYEILLQETEGKEVLWQTRLKTNTVVVTGVARDKNGLTSEQESHDTARLID